MRSINKEYAAIVTQTVTKVATKQDFSYINKNKELRLINFEVISLSDDGEILERKAYQLNDADYDLIMSDSPDFAPGKPVNDFREADLFYMIDKLDR